MPMDAATPADDAHERPAFVGGALWVLVVELALLGQRIPEHYVRALNKTILGDWFKKEQVRILKWTESTSSRMSAPSMTHTPFYLSANDESEQPLAQLTLSSVQ